MRRPGHPATEPRGTPRYPAESRGGLQRGLHVLGGGTSRGCVLGPGGLAGRAPGSRARPPLPGPPPVPALGACVGTRGAVRGQDAPMGRRGDRASRAPRWPRWTAVGPTLELAYRVGSCPSSARLSPRATLGYPRFDPRRAAWEGRRPSPQRPESTS
jgi:hypothetical protein